MNRKRLLFVGLLMTLWISGCSNSETKTADYVPTNQVIVNPQYGDYTNFYSEGLAPVYQNSAETNQRAGFIDLNGKLVIPMTFGYVGNFSSGMALAELNGKVGYINTKGEFVINPQFDYAQDFSDGVAAVCYSNDNFQCGYINAEGKIITSLDITSPDYQTQASEGFFAACHGSMDDCRYSFSKTDGTPANFGFFDSARPFSEGLAAVEKRVGDDYLWGFINKKVM